MLRVRPLDPATRTVTAVGLGILAGFGSLFLWWQVFYNTLGPLDHLGMAVAVALLATATTGVAAYAGSRWLLARWWPGALLAVGVVVALGFTVGPRELDDDVERCSGWELAYYSPGSADGSADTYCLGLESPA